MQHVAVANGSLGVEILGKGPPILFVHGFPLGHGMWKQQLAAFSKTHRVIAPDLRGFGESSVTPNLVTMEQFADDLHGLLHGVTIDGPVVLCALSMGGYVAWQFFKKYRPQLKALILCDTRAVADTSEAAAARRQLAESVTQKGPQAVLDAMLPRLLAKSTVDDRPEVVGELRSIVLRNKAPGIVAALHGMIQRPDCSDLLPTIDVPTLLICGQEDQISTVDEMQSMAQSIPGAQFAVIPNAGHMPPMETPAAFNAEVKRFLDSLRR